MLAICSTNNLQLAHSFYFLPNLIKFIKNPAYGRQSISLLPITFPEGFQKSKKFGHRTLGSGEKRHLNGVNKEKKNP